MTVSLARLGATLLLLNLPAGSPGSWVAACDDPLPIDPEVVTREMKLTGFRGTRALGPACRLSWEGGTQPGLLIYGPSSLADMGFKFSSPREAADHYAGEAPKGVEPLPGVPNGYMVFDPKIPNRRVFLEHKHKVYMIVSQDKVPLAVLAKAVIKS